MFTDQGVEVPKEIEDQLDEYQHGLMPDKDKTEKERLKNIANKWLLDRINHKETHKERENIQQYPVINSWLNTLGRPTLIAIYKEIERILGITKSN